MRVQLGIRNQAEADGVKDHVLASGSLLMTHCTLHMATCRTLHMNTVYMAFKTQHYHSAGETES